MYIQRRKSKAPLLRLLALILAFLLFLLYCFVKMRPVIISYGLNTAKKIIINSANQAVINVLKNNDIEYNDIVTLARDDLGEVTSLETNIVKINTLKSEINGELTKIISKSEYYEFSIPLGTFLSNEYTNGYGPRLKFRMQVSAVSEIDFSHQFTSAGINQVLHIIIIKMHITGSLVSTGKAKSFTTDTSAIAAQTVIVGTVPDAFTQVVENEGDNLAGLINDYGAQAN